MAWSGTAARDATRGPSDPWVAGRHLLFGRGAHCVARLCLNSRLAPRNGTSTEPSAPRLRHACGASALRSSRDRPWTQDQDRSLLRVAARKDTTTVYDVGCGGLPQVGRSLGAEGSVLVPFRGASLEIRHRRATQCAPRHKEVPARGPRMARPAGCVPRGRARFVLAESRPPRAAMASRRPGPQSARSTAFPRSKRPATVRAGADAPPPVWRLDWRAPPSPVRRRPSPIPRSAFPPPARKDARALLLPEVARYARPLGRSIRRAASFPT